MRAMEFNTIHGAEISRYQTGNKWEIGLILQLQDNIVKKKRTLQNLFI